MDLLEEEVKTEKESWFKNLFEFIIETLKVVVVSVAIILPVRYYLIQPFYVKGASMEPNFHDHEYLIIDEISYRFNEPKRGDIVVFRYAQDHKSYFIKRVIGLPGEKVEIKDSKITIYNKANSLGKMIDESVYLDTSTMTTPDITTILGDDEYFVLGDNRNNSLDSRRIGPIKRNSLIGRTWFRGWPFDRIGWFETPSYNL